MAQGLTFPRDPKDPLGDSCPEEESIEGSPAAMGAWLFGAGGRLPTPPRPGSRLPPAPACDNRRSMRAGWRIYVIRACFAARVPFYAAMLPLWEGFDEWAHFSAIRAIPVGGAGLSTVSGLARSTVSVIPEDRVAALSRPAGSRCGLLSSSWMVIT